MTDSPDFSEQEEYYWGMSQINFQLTFPLSALSLSSPHPRWRGRMQHALHDPRFHILIVVLVCLDALIVIFELLIDVGAFSKSIFTV